MMYKTERLYLLTPSEAMAHEVKKYLDRNKNFLVSWEPIRENEYFQLDAVRKRLAYESMANEEGSAFKLYIQKNNGTSIIGSVHLSGIIRGPFLSCFLGYQLDENEINNGYMTEAVSFLCDVAFKTFGLHRIEANIMPRNTASIAIVKKLQFIEEGFSRQYLKINGVWEDHIHFVLLNS